MKFLKKSQLNFRNVGDQSVAVTMDSPANPDTPRIVMENDNSLLIPKGPTVARPDSFNVVVDGMIRYNTTTEEFEFRQESRWRAVRFKESVGIIQQYIGDGNSDEIYFGPLHPDPYVDTNGETRTVDQNKEWTANGNVLTPGDIWTGANLIVLIENVFQIYQVNYTIVQNPLGTPSASFYSGAQTYPQGWYLKFDDTLPVPYGKPVTVLHGFDR